ncbi:MAG: MliC family protein [Synechococcaceae cyanobacterium]|nr:MliC family protein [Synechococcaceae cyanobacterium]
MDVTVLFFNRSPADVVLLVGETTTRLPQQPAADGARQATADQSFWIKGDQARWQLGQAPPLRCLTRQLRGGQFTCALNTRLERFQGSSDQETA